MARGRMISKSLSTSVAFAKLFDELPILAEFAQSLYPLLVSHTDDFGREQGDLDTVKYRIHPRSPRSVDDFGLAMAALAKVGLIQWYEIKGKVVYQIVKFDDHQTGLHKRTRSQFPPPSGSSRKFPESPGQLKGRELNRTEGNLTEENRTEENTDTRAPANPHSKPTNLIDGSELRIHGQHAWCSWPERDGLCVPAFLHREFVGKLGRDTADHELRNWYPLTVRQFEGRAVGDNGLDFWRNEFSAWVGTVTSKPAATRSSDSTDAAKRSLQRELDRIAAEEGETPHAPANRQITR